jgi:hypothetical protein
MKTLIPPRLATWLLEHFVTSSNTEAILGDLTERYQAGKSRAWYWRQVVTAIVVHALNKNREPIRIGFIIGTIAGAIAIAENIVRNDPHLVSVFPTLITPVIAASTIYLTARHWRQAGRSTAEVANAVRRSALVAALVFGLSHAVFSLCWFSQVRAPRDPLLAMWPLAAFGAVAGFVGMFFILLGSGYVAAKLSGRNAQVAR